MQTITNRSPALPSRFRCSRRATCLLLAALLVSMGSRASRGADASHDDPDAELKSFHIADGYEVNLFASEKDGIVKPVAMRWDAEGRLWVACIPSYPQITPGEQPDDKIVILQDTDGKGRANFSTVFAHGLSLPLGLELGNSGAYVGSGGELLFLKDSKGNLKADQKQVLLRGFYSADSHQNINNFVWGPGGQLMFCQGLHAFSHVETPWGTERLEKAGIWRFWPREMRLDPFLGRDTGPQNPYGIVFDDWGQSIMTAGNGQGVYYLTPSLIRTDHLLDPRQIWDRQGVKFAGPDILGSRHLPDDAQGLLIAGSIMDNSVWWCRLTEDGSGYHAVALPPLLTSTHSSFRAVDVKVGPDGAIYVLDWYNPIIGHYQASLRHPDRDHAHGRIWRITAKGRPLVEKPALTHMDIPALLEQLKSPERWVRYQTKRLLTDKDAKDVTSALGTWISHLDPKQDGYEHLLLEALGVYEAQGVVEPALLGKLLQARDYRVRAYATDVTGHWHAGLENPAALLARQATDEHPRVRLEAVVAASYLQSPQALEAAVAVVDRPMDGPLTYALTQTVHALKPAWKPALDRGELALGNNPARLEFVFKADGSSDVLQSLVGLLKSPSMTPESRATALTLLATIGGPNEIAQTLADPSLRAKEGDTSNHASIARVLDALAVNSRLHPAARAADAASSNTLTSYVRSTDPSIQRPAVTVAGLWKLEPLYREVEKTARAANASAPLRTAAVEALADYNTPAAAGVLKDLAGTEPDARLRAAAISALARVDLPAASTAAIALLSDPKNQQSASDLVVSFLNRQGGADALASAATRAAILPPDAAKLALRAMSSAGRQDPALWDVLSKYAGTSSQRLAYNPEIVKSLAQEAMTQGDAARGQTVFRGTTTNCMACHAIGGAGGRVGPDLATVGAANPIELVVESVLWPNKQVKEGFTATLVETKNGDVQQGYRAGQQNGELLLRDPPTDRLIHIPLAQIKRQKDIGSLMPDGVTDGLTRQELRDLIRFLSELGKPGDYRVAAEPIVRNYESLVRPPESMRAGVAATDALPAVEPGAWAPRYATVSGLLPLVDIADANWFRFQIDVVKAGSFNVRFNDERGLLIWLDGRPIALASPHELKLDTGLHTVTLHIDPATRAGLGITSFLDPSGAGGEARLQSNISSR